MALVRAALRNPHLVIVFMLMLAVLGITGLERLPRDLLPIFQTPAVQIVTLYPGMAPEVVEKDITSRLERWTGQAVGIDRQEATSMLGVSIVKDFFREDIDMATAISQVTSLAVSDMFYLPPGTLPPMVMPFDPTASVPLCLLSVSSDTMTEKELYDVAYFEMRNRLQSIRGVIAPAVYGGVLRRILAYLKRDELEARNLSALDVVKALQQASPFVPTGSARLAGQELFLLSNAMPIDVRELDNVPIKFVDGVPVLLGDVARVEDTHQIQSNIVRINGRRQVYIPIYRQPGSNTLEIIESVRSKAKNILANIREFDPKAADLRMDVVMDQSAIVRGSISSLTNSALIGALLVALIVLLFLRSIRSTAIVLVAIPMAVLGAFFALFLTGDTINAMTLGGLSLSIGILVDQSIVVMENIMRHRKMGKSSIQAAYDGAGEVAMPVFVSTMTFMVVFFPVIFLSGMAKFLFTPLALAVIFATLTSYLLAMTFIPSAAARLPKAIEKEDGFFDRLARAYRGVAAVTLRFRWAVLIAAFSLFGLAAFGLTRLGTELFPPVDAGQFMILVRAQPGTPLTTTEVLVEEIETEVMKKLGKPDPENKDASSELRLLISNIGVLYDWPAAYTPNTGPMDAFLLIQLKESRKKSAQERARELRKHLNETFPGVEFAFDTGGMMTAALNMGLPSPINIQVKGSKLESCHLIATAIMNEIHDIEGAVDVRIAQPLDAPALMINVDRIKAGALGLTQEEVIKNVATALNSSVNFAPSFWIDSKNGNHYLVGAQYPESEIQDLATLENIAITGSKSKKPTLLKNIATITRTRTPVVIKHNNITRTIDVFVNVDGRDAGSIATEIENRLASPALAPLIAEYGKKGYRVEMAGEIKSMRESFDQFSQGLLIAAILVYLVMVAQFRSFLVPLSILLTVPLGLIGVVAALWLTGTHLSIPAFMGLILMVGIVVQYSILIVDFAVRRQRKGASVNEAILDAAQSRLRPVLMTSLTTCLALVPMAIGFQRGGEANIPLARAIIGAVVGGTILSLLVVPALYSVIGRWIKAVDAEQQSVLDTL